MRCICMRFWLPVLALLVVAATGCNVAPGARADRPAGPEAVAEQGPRGAGAAAAPGTGGPPAGPGGTVQLPPGVYLASLIVLDVNSDYGVPVVAGPNVGTFPTGEIRLVILNKWGGLTPGRHREDMQVLAPDGITVLATDHTDFEITPEHVYLTIASPLRFRAGPGWHQVVIHLDGRQVMRYQFLVREAEG